LRIFGITFPELFPNEFLRQDNIIYGAVFFTLNPIIWLKWYSKITP